MKLSQRIHTPEWIDLGPDYYTRAEYEDCLYQLDRIGRYLGGDQASFQAFQKLSEPPNSILDVGCGGGTLTMRLAEYYPHAQVLGIDIAQEAIIWAQKRLQAYIPPLTNIKFQVPSTPQLEYLPKTFDVVTSTLVCHHLSDEALIDFLKQSYRIAKKAVILNDLHRHILAEKGFSIIARLFFRNRLIIHDGLLSIKRAFIYDDWVNYLQAAAIPLDRCSITWHWPFRWTVFINAPESEN